MPFDQLNAELFYPKRQENKDTTEIVTKLALEVAQCFLEDLCDPTKATSDYLSSAEGKFSWGETTEEEHMACIGKMATNDLAESPIKSRTYTLTESMTDSINPALHALLVVVWYNSILNNSKVRAARYGLRWPPVCRNTLG